PISAKDDARLKAYGRRLLDSLKEGPNCALADLAYTLQIGREEMPSRVAFVVEDRASLADALGAFLAGKDGRVYRTGALEQQAEGAGDRLAARWVSGEDVDWSVLHRGANRRRIHAVTYPFARERHWMDESLGAKDPEAVLHPLLHRNVSQ